jgi:hypothetical protein
MIYDIRQLNIYPTREWLMLPVLYTTHFNLRNGTTFVGKHVPPQYDHLVVEIYWRCDIGFNQQTHIWIVLGLRIYLCVKQEGQSKYNVTPRSVYVPIVEVEKQQVWYILECVAVALVFQHAKWMRRIILSPVACPSEPYFLTFSHKQRDFQEKILNIKRLILSQTHISLICDNSVTTQNLWFFRRSISRFWSAIIFYECNDYTTALQRRVLQTALWYYTC